MEHVDNMNNMGDKDNIDNILNNNSLNNKRRVLLLLIGEGNDDDDCRCHGNTKR